MIHASLTTPVITARVTQVDRFNVSNPDSIKKSQATTQSRHPRFHLRTKLRLGVQLSWIFPHTAAVNYMLTHQPSITTPTFQANARHSSTPSRIFTALGGQVQREMADKQNTPRSVSNPPPEQAVPLQPLAAQPQPPPQTRAPYYPQPAYPVSGKWRRARIIASILRTAQRRREGNDDLRSRSLTRRYWVKINGRAGTSYSRDVNAHNSCHPTASPLFLTTNKERRNCWTASLQVCAALPVVKRAAFQRTP